MHHNDSVTQLLDATVIPSSRMNTDRALMNPSMKNTLTKHN